MRMRKLVLGLSVAQILPEKINKMLFLKNLGFFDVNRTVSVREDVLECVVALSKIQEKS